MCNLRWFPGSPVFDKARATGLRVTRLAERDPVNMLGKRFYDETGRQFTANNYKGIDPYIPGTSATRKNIRYEPEQLAQRRDGRHRRRPERRRADLGDLRPGAVEREKWDPKPPNVDIDGGFFFKADTVAELAEEDRDEVPARADAAGESRRNRRPATTPSSTSAATWTSTSRGRCTRSRSRRSTQPGATPVLHDTRAGLRINARCQVVDMNGEVIAGLYCGGESAGGFSLHGLARCLSRA